MCCVCFAGNLYIGHKSLADYYIYGKQNKKQQQKNIDNRSGEKHSIVCCIKLTLFYLLCWMNTVITALCPCLCKLLNLLTYFIQTWTTCTSTLAYDVWNVFILIVSSHPGCRFPLCRPHRFDCYSSAPSVEFRCNATMQVMHFNLRIHMTLFFPLCSNS